MTACEGFGRHECITVRRNIWFGATCEQQQKAQKIRKFVVSCHGVGVMHVNGYVCKSLQFIVSDVVLFMG